MMAFFVSGDAGQRATTSDADLRASKEMKMKKWIKMVLFFPAMVLLGVGGTGEGDEGATETIVEGEASAGSDPVVEGEGEGAETEGAEMDDPAEGDTETQPVAKKPEARIPEKAYMEEKRKRQELEAEVKALKATPPPAAKQPQTIEEHFDVNPAGVLNYIDQQIRDAKAGYDDTKVAELQATKTDLVARGLLNSERKTSRETFLTKVNAEIYKAIPDFDDKKAGMVQMAKEYGLNDQEAEDIFNPEVVGDTAVRMAKMMARVYSVTNAGKTAKGKEVKTPMKTESAGAGGFENRTAQDKQLARAKETGSLDDWAKALG